MAGLLGLKRVEVSILALAKAARPGRLDVLYFSAKKFHMQQNIVRKYNLSKFHLQNMPPSTDYPRRRSRSPHRPSKSGGFRWKSKPTDDEERRRHRRDSRRDRSRSRSRRRRSYSRSRSPPRRFSLSPRRERDRSPRRFSEERRDGRANGSNGRKKDGHRGDRSPPPPKLKEKKNKPAAIQQEMIVVNVNDRLGTKTAIPCLASDPVGK